MKRTWNGFQTHVSIISITKAVNSFKTEPRQKHIDIMKGLLITISLFLTFLPASSYCSDTLDSKSEPYCEDIWRGSIHNLSCPGFSIKWKEVKDKLPIVLAIASPDVADTLKRLSGIAHSISRKLPSSTNKKRDHHHFRVQSKIDDLTLRFYDLLCNFSICRQKTSVAEKLVCAYSIFRDISSDERYLSFIMWSLLRDKLHTVSTKDIERLVLNLNINEATYVLTYLYGERQLFFKHHYIYIDKDFIDFTRAFFTPNLLEAYKIHKKAAFMRYLHDNKVITLPANVLVYFFYLRSDLSQHSEHSEKFNLLIQELEKEKTETIEIEEIEDGI